MVHIHVVVGFDVREIHASVTLALAVFLSRQLPPSSPLQQNTVISRLSLFPRIYPPTIKIRYPIESTAEMRDLRLECSLSWKYFAGLGVYGFCPQKRPFCSSHGFAPATLFSRDCMQSFSSTPWSSSWRIDYLPSNCDLRVCVSWHRWRLWMANVVM